MTLADRAFEVYDQQGEREMINFLIDNRDPGTPQDTPESLGVYPLADGSGIEAYSDIYTNERTQEYRDVKLAPGEIPLYPMETAPMLAWPNSETIRAGVLAAAFREARERLREERLREERLREERLREERLREERLREERLREERLREERLPDERTPGGEGPGGTPDPRGPDQLIPLSQALSLAPSLDGEVANAIDIQEREGLPEHVREFLEDRQRSCAELRPGMPENAGARGPGPGGHGETPATGRGING